MFFHMLPRLKESVPELFRYLIQFYGIQGKLIYCFILVCIGNYFTWYCFYGKHQLIVGELTSKKVLFEKESPLLLRPVILISYLFVSSEV